MSNQLSTTFSLDTHFQVKTEIPAYSSYSFGSTDFTVGGGPSPEIKAVGDLNNDGIDDLVIDYYETSVQPLILLGSQSGEFQVLDYSEPEAARRHIRNGELADLNNDGFLDFIGFTTGDPGERWVESVGTDYGQIIPRGQSDLVLINLGGSDFAELSVPEVRLNDWNHGGSTGDLDNDGFIDILPVSEGEQERTVPLQSVGGTSFVLGDSEYSSDVSFYLTPDLDVGDLNNDGFADIVVAMQNQNDRSPTGNNQIGMIRLIYGDGDFDFSNNREESLGEAWLSQNDADQLAARSTSVQVVGSGQPILETYVGSTNVEIIDVDSDGLLDILHGQFVTNSGLWGTAGFKYFKNSGDGFVDMTDEFFPNQQTNRNIDFDDPREYTAPYIHNFYQADINGDDLLDIVLQHDGTTNWHDAEENIGYPYIFINTNNQTFLPIERSSVASLVHLDDIVPGDFNGDGQQDLLGIYGNVTDTGQVAEITTFLAPTSADWSVLRDPYDGLYELVWSVSYGETDYGVRATDRVSFDNGVGTFVDTQNVNTFGALRSSLQVSYDPSGNILFSGVLDSLDPDKAYGTKLQGTFESGSISGVWHEGDLISVSMTLIEQFENDSKPYEWADVYYDYLWNPLDDDRVNTGSIDLTISAADLISGDSWGVLIPMTTYPDGETDVIGNLVFDEWIDIDTGDLYLQVSNVNGLVGGIVRVTDYYQLFPTLTELDDFWVDLNNHPLSQIDLATPFESVSEGLNRFPYQDATMLPQPTDTHGVDFDPTFISFRNMLSLDATTGRASFAPLNQVYKGGEFESHFTSEPGNTTYVEGPASANSYYSGGIKYGNAPAPIKVDFAINQVLEDGWGYVDDFTQWEQPHIQGTEFGDEFLNIDNRNFTGFAGNDWIHSFKEGGAWIGVGFGADFVDATSIVSTSPNAKWWTNVQLTADDIWKAGYYALNANAVNHVGTGDLISLDGYRQIQDVVFGSAEGYIRVEVKNADDFSNDDDKGIALFVDDMLTARHVESGQASEKRLKDIAEIHATVLDDIIDLTSSYHADQTGNVKVYGMDGDDILWGGSSNETLDGGNGADLINGGAGNDTLTGGYGADIFEFTATSGNDTITDFAVVDILKFYRRETDTNDAVIDEVNGQVTWQADGHTVTIDFGTDITASMVAIQYELI